MNELAKTFLKNKIQTIVFARSRVRVEIILSHIQEIVKRKSARSLSEVIAADIFRKKEEI